MISGTVRYSSREAWARGVEVIRMRREHYYSDEMRIAYAAKFAEELAEILYEVGITHRELSLQLGVAHATVDSWTRVVNPKVPNERNILRLGEFLDKSKPGASTRISTAAGQRVLIDGQAAPSTLQTITTLGKVPKENDARVEVEGETHLRPAMITAYPSNILPSLTQFVGRTEEIIEVRRLLEKARLLRPMQE